MTTETTDIQYGRGRKRKNDKYVKDMTKNESRMVYVTPATVGRMRSGIHAAGFRHGMSIETAYDSVAGTLQYKRIK